MSDPLARRLGALALVLGPGLGGCIPSNVVAPAERRVLPTVEELTWLEPEPGDVPGFYRSESVAGPMASVVQALYYLFRTDGTYTGAALLGADRPTFQTLTGTWELADGRLRLDLQLGLRRHTATVASGDSQVYGYL